MTPPLSIGFIGTGIMGSAMVSHLLAARHRVTLFNRTPSKLHSLLSKGAVAATSPADLARRSELVFVMVGFPHDVEQVVLDPTNGVLAHLSPGSVLCDLTTSSPTLARTIHAQALLRNIAAMDAPVTGGDVGAREAKLTIMVGADPSSYAKIEPVLKLFGKPILCGPPGQGQVCKMANQITIASTMMGVCEGLLFAHRKGLDLDLYFEAIRHGGAASRSLDLYAPRLLKADLQPGFLVKHFVKDLGIALDEARQANLALPGLALANQLYMSLLAYDEGELGTQALIECLSRLNRVSDAPWSRRSKV